MAKACTAFTITDNDQSSEAKTLTTLNRFRNTVDVHELFNQLFATFFILTAATIITAAATTTLIAATTTATTTTATFGFSASFCGLDFNDFVVVFVSPN